MRFGKISAILLGIAAATMCAAIVLSLVVGKPFATLAGLLSIFSILSIPASLIVGMIGLVLDRRKLLAFITTIVAGGLVILIIFGIPYVIAF
jgi:phosphoribosylcarboxyaminoimidazole (NCAIR) mutase